MIRLFRKLRDKIFSAMTNVMLFVELDATDNSITLSRRLVKHVKDKITEENNVYVFKVLEEYAFAINVKELKNEDTVRAPLQYNDRHKTVGFYAACPSVNRIVYDYNLPDQAIVRVKKKRKKNIEYFIMKNEYWRIK